LFVLQLSDQHGLETYLHFLRRLIAAAAARVISPNPPASWDTSTVLTYRLLVQETQRLARDPFLADRFRDAIDKADSEPFRHFELGRFVDRVGLSALERLIIASSMLSATNRRDLVQQAVVLIRQNIDQARQTLMAHPTFESGNINQSQAAKLLSNILCESSSETPVLDPTQRQNLLSTMSSKYGPDFVASAMKQIIPRLNMQPGPSLAQTLVQFGPEVTSDVELVRALMTRIGITDADPPTDLQVLETINRLARYAFDGSPMPDIRVLVRAFNSFVSPFSSRFSRSHGFLETDVVYRMSLFNGIKQSGF